MAPELTIAIGLPAAAKAATSAATWANGRGRARPRPSTSVLDPIFTTTALRAMQGSVVS